MASWGQHLMFAENYWMPLSKARMRERKRQDRLGVKPVSNLTNENTELAEKMLPIQLQAFALANVKPKLPWYAGAGGHFGEVRNKRYAKEFFALL